MEKNRKIKDKKKLIRDAKVVLRAHEEIEMTTPEAVLFREYFGSIKNLEENGRKSRIRWKKRKINPFYHLTFVGSYVYTVTEVRYLSRHCTAKSHIGNSLVSS